MNDTNDIAPPIVSFKQGEGRKADKQMTGHIENKQSDSTRTNSMSTNEKVSDNTQNTTASRG